MFTLQLVRLMLYFVQILRSVRHNARAADVRSDRDMTDTRPLAELTLVEAALRYVPVVSRSSYPRPIRSSHTRPDATTPPPPLMG